MCKALKHDGNLSLTCNRFPYLLFVLKNVYSKMSRDCGEDVKTVIVEVELVNNMEEYHDEYEITFKNRDRKVSDLKSIWKQMSLKNAALKRLPKNAMWFLNFQVLSSQVPGL